MSKKTYFLRWRVPLPLIDINVLILLIKYSSQILAIFWKKNEKDNHSLSHLMFMRVRR